MMPVNEERFRNISLLIMLVLKINTFISKTKRLDLFRTFLLKFGLVLKCILFDEQGNENDGKEETVKTEEKPNDDQEAKKEKEEEKEMKKEEQDEKVLKLTRLVIASSSVFVS